MDKLSWFERWWLNAWPHRLHIRTFVPRFLRACPDPFRGEVLEVGAGSGWTSRRILETFPQVELTAVDTDPRALETYQPLQKQYGQRLHVQEADMRTLPFARDSFDIVVALHSLHYVSDLERALQQLLRVLRPGGLLGIAEESQRYVVGPMRWLWRQESMVTVQELERLVAEEGCEILVQEGTVHFYMWIRKPYPVGTARDREGKS